MLAALKGGAGISQDIIMKRDIYIEKEQALLVSITDITYKYYECSSGYKPLKLSLMLPKYRDENTARPLLIWVCGGGFEVLDKDVWMPEMQFFARNGYSIASIEYRTHNQKAFPGLIEDAKEAVRFLRAHAGQYGIDPARFAMMGESAGGYISSMVGVTGNTKEFDTGEYLDQPSDIQAVINIYGRTRQERGWYEKIEQGRPRNTTELLMNGKPEDIPETYKKATPTTYVREGLPPFLLLHGTDDKAVPVIQNDLFYDDLKGAGTEVDYYRVIGAGHGGSEFYQPQIKRIILEFMNKYLMTQDSRNGG